MLILKVKYIPQSGRYDCWHASLRMVYKTRYGDDKEPKAHGALAEGAAQEKRHQDRVNDELRKLGPTEKKSEGTGDEFSDAAVNESFARKIANSDPDLRPRGLHKDEFEAMAGLNNMASPLLPTSWMKVREKGFTAASIEQLLRSHGPLWVARVLAGSYPHVVVVVGVDAENKIVFHDPMSGEGKTQTISMFNQEMAWGPYCVSYLPAQSCCVIL